MMWSNGPTWITQSSQQRNHFWKFKPPEECQAIEDSAHSLPGQRCNLAVKVRWCCGVRPLPSYTVADQLLDRQPCSLRNNALASDHLGTWGTIQAALFCTRYNIAKWCWSSSERHVTERCGSRFSEESSQTIHANVCANCGVRPHQQTACRMWCIAWAYYCTTSRRV